MKLRSLESEPASWPAVRATPSLQVAGDTVCSVSRACRRHRLRHRDGWERSNQKPPPGRCCRKSRHCEPYGLGRSLDWVPISQALAGRC